MKLAMLPASVMPSSRICPSVGLGVRQQQVVVDRLVLLALRRVDLQLAEQRVHAERAGLVGDDRHDVLAELLVTRQVAQQAGEAHRGADGLAAGTLGQLGERLGGGQRQRLARVRVTLGDRAAERAAALHHVLVLDRVLGRPEVRRQVALERFARGSRRAGTTGRAAPAADPWSSS